MPRPTGYIRELDGLRGIAILLVMVHRLYPRELATPWYVEGGWIGVDLFFVVSGFLIAGILLDTRGDDGYFRNFYARRVLRIFPLFYVLVGGMLLASAVLGHRAFLEQAGSPLWYLLQLGNLPEAVLGKDPPYWLAPAWSLAIEEQFYLTFPLLVRLVEPARLGRCLVAMAGVALVARVVTTFAWPANERLQYQLTLCRLDAIAAGCGIALLVRSRRAIPRQALDVMIGVALGIALATHLDRTTVFGRTGGYSVVALGFAALVLRVVEARPRMLRFAPLCYLGKLCFGLYLLHRPADTITIAALHRLGLDPAHVAWIPLKIGVAVGLASASWYLLEQPFLRFKRLFVSSRHPVAAAAAALLVACHSPSHARPDATLADPAPDAIADGALAIDASDDAGLDGGMPLGKIRYPEGRLQSPMTSDVADALAAIAAHGAQHADTFAKVGDSITASTSFFCCLDGSAADLGQRPDLAGTVSAFQGWFSRASLAAQGGWQTSDELAGSPPPIDQEVAAIAPRFAVVMLGTNDNRYGRTVDAFGSDLWTIVDRLRDEGVIPILSTIPPTTSDPYAAARVPLFNRVIRALAQGRSLPLVDLEMALAPLANQGLSSDGIHPSANPSGDCALDAQGLAYGYPTRNLVTLDALDRARRGLAGSALDASAPRFTGTGTAADPYRGGFPLVDLGNTRTADHAVTYRVDLGASTAIEAYVVDHGAVDVDVAIADASHAPLATGDASATATVGPGAVYITVTSHAITSDGEFLLVVDVP